MKKILFLLLPTFLFSCIWINGTTIDGDYKETSDYGYSSILKHIIENESAQTKLENLLDNKASFTTLTNEIKENDAVILMLQGKYESSIEMLLALNQKNPKKYSIASNLGTVYELNGENKKALQWIKEGTKRDKNSHYGTEWLHELILKTKIEQKNNPNLLQNQRVIALSPKFTLKSTLKIEGEEHTISDILKALRYQLRERLIFVKPKEPIVADLIFTYAKIEAETGTLEEALKILTLAKDYGFSDPQLLQESQERYEDIIKHPSLLYHIKSLQKPDNIVKFVMIILLLIILILIKRAVVYMYKKVVA